MKLIGKYSNRLEYMTDHGIIEIYKCLDPNIYADTGYYLSIDTMQRMPKLKGIHGYKSLAGIKSHIKKRIEK